MSQEATAHERSQKKSDNVITHSLPQARGLVAGVVLVSSNLIQFDLLRRYPISRPYMIGCKDLPMSS